MAAVVPNEQAIFEVARKMDAGEAYEAYLQQIDVVDPAIGHRVRALLKAYEENANFLESPAAASSSADPASAPAESPGTIIGSYKLLEQIGEGGFGVVFMAEQQQPVRRRVALKVVKPGMDTRQVIARFEAERQALALMDHPNIARVFDGGETASGRPYFVMELVRGVPITDFCDQSHLSIRERLALFIHVCQAVQHAHLKGIIHRDLKPTNVLVTLLDSLPVVKVIDFGIAKATGQQLTEKTLFTNFAQMIGTPLYMSPEQAQMSAVDVDTRSDIYSLGVLLYELLTGTTPFDKEQLRTAAFDEIRRIIREEEPARPSTRLSTLGQAAATVSANRRSDPGRLSELCRGELDWIVMKSLEKDRNRRYETANGFAADVQRYLADEPVQACPPSALYRLRKFARRNTGKLAATAVLGLALLLAVSAIGWAVRDRSARGEEANLALATRQARVTGQVQLILGEVARLEREQNWPEALDAARRAADLVTGREVEADVAGQVQDTMRALVLVRLLEDIRADKSEWKEGSFDYRRTAERYAAAFRDNGIDLARLTPEEAADRLRSWPDVLAALIPALDDWAICRNSTGDQHEALSVLKVAGLVDPDPWRQQVRQALATGDMKSLLALSAAPNLARQPAATLTKLGIALRKMDRVDAALGVLAVARRQHPSDFWVHFDMAQTLARKDPPSREQAAGSYRTAIGLRPRNAPAWNNLANVLWDQGKQAEAIDCLNKAIELDPKFATAHRNLGVRLFALQKRDDAIASYQKAIELDPNKATAQLNLGNLFWMQRKLDDAVACYRKAIELDPKNATAHSNLGNVLYWQGKFDEAIACCRKAVELDPINASAQYNLGVALIEKKKFDDAIVSLNKAIELDPHNASAHNYLGGALLGQRKLDDAIACFRKAIELNPKDAMAHSNIGSVLSLQGKPDEAIACYRKAIELDPQLAAAHRNLGNALTKQGKLAEALASRRKVVELLPRNASDHNALAWLLATCPDPQFRAPDRAVELAKKAVELTPKVGSYWNTLGVAHYRAGDWKSAALALEKSMELSQGGDANDWLFLAMAYRQRGEKEKAREWYDRAVRWMEKNRPKDEELRRFRAEAEDVLEIKK